MANRHLSRSIVLQTLFEWDFLPQAGGPQGDNQKNETAKDILDRNILEFGPGLEEGDRDFMYSLVDSVLKKRSIIDEIICCRSQMPAKFLIVGFFLRAKP